MKAIKLLLFKVLSQKSYLRVLHRSFYFLYSMGFLKKNESFKYHYLVKKLIDNDDTVLDIGANLGYFCKTFARLAKNGKVIAIEPVPAFYETLTYFLGSYKNVTIHNVALGTENGKIDMVLPTSDGMIRTGLPHIAKDEAEKKENKTVEVAIVKGSELLANLESLNYIKCDIEGYEWTVFQEIKPVIEKHRPIIQLEISGENEENMLDYFKKLDYQQYGVVNFEVIEENGKQQEPGDFLFVPMEKKDVLKRKLDL